MQRQETERAGWLATLRGEFEARLQAQEATNRGLQKTLKEISEREAKLIEEIKQLRAAAAVTEDIQ
jgi:cell division protein FtsB